MVSKMITINKILIDNFRGFEKETEILVGDTKLVLLDAPNGTGKTTLLDAIEWCLTGKIGRIQAVYEKRLAKSDQKLEYNSKAILKNKNQSDKNTQVELEVICDQQRYSVIREQKKDTLLQPGTLKVLDSENKEIDNAIINEWVQEDTFYQYHIFDMQKAYNLLSKKKDEVQNLFSDFTKQYKEADTVINNLGFYQNDIDMKIEQLKKQQTSNEDIAKMQEKLSKSVVSPENLQYEKKVLFESENLEVEKMSLDELNKQLEKLYCCGYMHLRESLTIVNSCSEAKCIDGYLEKINQEIEKNPENIKIFVEKKYFEKNNFEEIIKKRTDYKAIKLTEDNIEETAENIANLGMSSFLKEYWVNKKEELVSEKAIKDSVQKEVDVLTKGNEILKIFTSLIGNKKFILDYRDEVKEKGKKIRCPVCGSEDRFSYISEDEILTDAKKYIEEHNTLLKEKTEILTERIEKISTLRKEILLKETEAIDSKIKDLDELISEYEQYNKKCHDYVEVITELQKINPEKYSYSSLNTKENADDAIRKNKVKIIPENELLDIIKQIKETSESIGFSLSEPFTNSTVREVVNRINEEFALKEFSVELLSKKVDAIKNYKKNDEFLELKRKLDNTIKTSNTISKEIEEFNNQRELANSKIKEIKDVKQKLEIEEYENIGPFLTKIFHKLSKDIHINDILLEKRSGEKNERELELCDENKHPIVNMLSDGQLSVFMLSYFLGNAFRLSNTKEISIYLMDDITSCLDDINMLSFLDLLKYQLKDENGVFDQIFFASCNSRIQALMEWKAQACGISCRKITINDYS